MTIYLKPILAAGALYGLYVFYILTMLFDGKALYPVIAGVDSVLFLLYVYSLWGIKTEKRGLRWVCYALMATGFGLGVYLIHFSWTFWIFHEPTLKERVLNILHPRVSVLVIFPVVWALYFRKK